MPRRAGRKHEALEARGKLRRGTSGDQAAERMPDYDSLLHLEGREEGGERGGIVLQRRRLVGEVERAAVAWRIPADHAELAVERGVLLSPRVGVAADAVQEDERLARGF